jgi:hypothetical protein
MQATEHKDGLLAILRRLYGLTEVNNLVDEMLLQISSLDSVMTIDEVRDIVRTS